MILLNLERALILIFSALFFYRGFYYSNPVLDSQFFFELSKSILVLFYIFKNRKPSYVKISLLSVFGVILSFVGVWFLSLPDSLPYLNVYFFWFGFSSIMFYTIIILIGYINLGENFGVFPALREVNTFGVFKLVRHPIYSGFVHALTTYLLIFPRLENFISVLFVFVGSYMRVFEEEKVLSKDSSYLDYIKKVKYRFFSPLFSLPLILVTIFTVLSSLFSDKEIIDSPMRVKLAYSVVSLNPVSLDDWSSLFAVNHIYPNLISSDDDNKDYSISSNFEAKCIKPSDEKNCDYYQYTFKIKEMSDCSGGLVNLQQFSNELDKILIAKPWILPNWKQCEIKNQSLCLEGPVIIDIVRRLKSIYFLFGWSNDIEGQNDRVGLGPYCMINVKRKNGNITSAKLVRKLKNKLILPEFEFYTASSKADTFFDLSLYGNEKVNDKKYKEIKINTPLAYYLVTNPKNENMFIPWNNKMAFNTIRNHMQKNKFIYVDDTYFKPLVPKGLSLLDKVVENDTSKKYYFAIPSYFPQCNKLKDQLVNLFGENVNVDCVDLVKFAQEALINRTLSWDAMILPLSSGAPFRSSISEQYFSKTSPESFFQASKQPENLYYLLGVGKTSITVNKDKICGIKTNPLGISRFRVTDIIFCK